MRHLVAAGLIAGSILRMPARAEVPSDREAVIEALIRQGFAGGCGPDGECLVAVEGKTPSRTLMLRIKDLRNVRAMPANYSGSGLIFDIGGVEFSAEGLAQAHGEIRGHGGPSSRHVAITFVECAGSGGWMATRRSASSRRAVSPPRVRRRPTRS
jgi:hypothetical protein